MRRPKLWPAGRLELWPAGRLARLVRIVVAAGSVLLLLGAGYLGWVTVRSADTLRLPGHPGAWPVGRSTNEWADTSRQDPLAPDDRPRTLSVFLWYPAMPGGSPAAYAPGRWSAIRQGVLKILATRPDRIRIRAVAGARPAQTGRRFPLLVLEPGLGQPAVAYTSLAEDLAAHGYVVAGITPTYSANVTVLAGRVIGSTRAGNPEPFDSGAGDRLVRIWAADDRFAVDRLTALDQDPGWPLAGHVDTGRVGYLGHSLGGAAALQACHDDNRCLAAADLDGTPFGPVVTDGLRVPGLVLGSQDSCVTGRCAGNGAEDRQAREAARQLRAASRPPLRVYELLGSKHVNFSDFGAYFLAPPVRQLIPLGGIDGATALLDTQDYLAAFFDAARGVAPAAALDCARPLRPEVRCVSCVDRSGGGPSQRRLNPGARRRLNPGAPPYLPRDPRR